MALPHSQTLLTQPSCSVNILRVPLKKVVRVAT